MIVVITNSVYYTMAMDYYNYDCRYDFHYNFNFAYYVKLVAFKSFSIVHILSRSSAQRCTNEGRQVLNSCLEVCYCINGRIQNCCRVRKHFTSMTEAERTRYVETVRRVSTESAYRQEYRRIINMHQRLFSTGIHQKDQFLPWHRW